MSTSNRRPWLILAICCMSLLIVGIDSTIVNVALPAIKNALGASLSGLQWTVDAYTLVIASFLMASGSTADRFGRRRVFQTGLALFTLGSLLCSLATSVTALVIFRCVQALGGSMLNPVALSIISNTFTERTARARAMGIWGAVFGISLALGPVLGGLLVTGLTWRAIFWINIPIGVAAIALTQLFVPESKAPRARRFDPYGQVLVIVMLATLTFGVIEGPDRGWASPLIIVMFAVAAAAAVSLVVVELHRYQPLLEIRFFRSVPFSGASVIAVLAFAILGGFLFLNTLYLQDGRGYSALHAGLLTLPMALMILIFAPVSGRLVGRRGPRLPLLLAGVAAVAGLALLTQLSDTSSLTYLLVCYVLLGPGLRPGQRADLEHRRVRDAEQPGRGGGVGCLGQPADRVDPRGRRHRVDRGRGARRPGWPGPAIRSGSCWPPAASRSWCSGTARPPSPPWPPPGEFVRCWTATPRAEPRPRQRLPPAPAPTTL